MAGFFLYHLLPITYVSHIYYSISSPVPIPFQKQCACALNPRSVYNSPLGNPIRLQKALKERGLNACYVEGGARGYKDLDLWKWLAYLSFEYMPKKLFLEEPSDPYSLIAQDPCMPIASDMPIFASIWTLDFPSYGFILGQRRNLYYSIQCGTPQGKVLIPYIGNKQAQVYAYSSMGFFFPGDNFRAPAVLNVSFFERKVLVFLFKDDGLYKVFDQRSIREPIRETGSYRLQAYTYRFRLWKIYFGLRFLLCTPAFYAM